MTTIFLTILITCLAATVFTTFGFGDALLAMPLLSVILGIKTAAPLMAMTSATLSAILLWRVWHDIAWQDTAKLLVAALLGIPIGIYGVKHVDESIMQLILGFIIISVSVFNLKRPQHLIIKNDSLAYVFGFVGGVLGGAYNTSGPPLVIYGTLRGWSPARFIGTLQGFFLPVNLSTVAAHYWAGTLTNEVGWYYLYCLPSLAIALIIGAWLRSQFDAEQYKKYVFGVLLVSGTLLLIKSVI